MPVEHEIITFLNWNFASKFVSLGNITKDLAQETDALLRLFYFRSQYNVTNNNYSTTWYMHGYQDVCIIEFSSCYKPCADGVHRDIWEELLMLEWWRSVRTRGIAEVMVMVMVTWLQQMELLKLKQYGRRLGWKLVNIGHRSVRSFAKWRNKQVLKPGNKVCFMLCYVSFIPLVNENVYFILFLFFLNQHNITPLGNNVRYITLERKKNIHKHILQPTQTLVI